MIVIYTDGAARGNPGPAAIAYTINLGQKTVEFGQPIGETTNNQAEYQALVAALGKLGELTPTDQEIQCLADSELMVKQLNGEYRMKNAELRPHFEQIQGMVAELKAAGNSISFTAVRRAENKRADELANLALDGQL